jgi:hypothetical protein
MIAAYSQQVTVTTYDDYVQFFIGEFDTLGYRQRSPMGRMH